MLRSEDSQEGVEDISAIEVQGLFVDSLGGCGCAVLQDDRLEVGADGIHGRGQDAEVGCDSGDGAQGDLPLLEPDIQIGPESMMRSAGFSPGLWFMENPLSRP